MISLPDSEGLLTKILGRSDSLMRYDIESHWNRISDKLGRSRILVIGAGGSIGGAFVRTLAQFRVAGLHLVDLSENGLVEVVRDLRSSGRSLPADFRTFAIDFGQQEFMALLAENTYDYVLNFSALKHVRSERDPYTLMRLLRTNVLANDDLLAQLSEKPPSRVFSVSSDKAVRPGNIMGASKAFMERVFLAHSKDVPFNSARFANVAFSAGSLLEGFSHRLAKRQPISAPNDVRRYFISHEEAGQLCMLGCFAGENREVFYPKLDPESDMLSFAEIARLVLESNNLEPRECGSEAEALALALELPKKPTIWPCYFSGSDTGGEKPFEEFVDPLETTDEKRFQRAGVITEPIDHGAEAVSEALHRIRCVFDRETWSKQDLIDAVRIAVPELEHVDADRNLDEKM